MPNTRRRRFSVQRDIAGRNQNKIQNGQQSSRSDADVELEMAVQTLNLAAKSNKIKNKINPTISKLTPLEMVAECDSSISLFKNVSINQDKNVGASSSNIDLYAMISAVETSDTRDVVETSVASEARDTADSRKDPKQTVSDVPRREKHPRHHRVKVRSPKRRMIIAEHLKTETEENKVSQGTNPIDFDQELEVYIDHVNVSNTEPTGEERVSNHSMDHMCRICHGGEALSPDLGQLVSACSCRGTVGRVHVKCLERWLTESGKSRCELCGTRYVTRRVHRYGVPRALVMWILSQNAKQMVDSLGIMLMSPLAVLAAWLSGRTLAGLMTQDIHVTPWPLASTFVLACMTLVCYYCWIVSAATRHALGWWIWYRSQYEVRLQLQENNE
ncbi:uncharacterized protein LOC113231926 isoform X2 [Hyposmocoma kahamanoa]|uniref:uncharacterized protein LOC113231926 isoform X2 n=1 Tax=Hyposmocoma kahamanoa TaxID=1477025 RepID=UPI000E6D8E05|nr:uncharacterized protein LOC113231926 isoform X2 [Hyposmocoma kahamanoa]